MTHQRELPLLIWPIFCFDRRRENPLPIYTRHYWLDWDQLTPEQTREILAIVEGMKNHVSPHKPVGFDETVITVSVGSPNVDTQMLKYRHLFTEIPDNDVEAFRNDPLRHDCGVQKVNVGAEYFEDETGKRLSNYEMMQHDSGAEFPIIVGDPDSILRLV